MVLSEYTKEFKYNLKLASPVMLGMLGHTFVSFVDNVMVGQLGAAELAAVSLGNSFIFIAMSLGIGFSTAIYNHHELEAHFLGFDASYNRSHQLYLNILYDLVEEAIAAGCKTTTFSRTALEIKSSVGAEAEHLYCWMRSRIAIANPLVPVVARFIAPLPEWEPRHPFKEE